MKALYIADDGTQFDDYDDCNEYEASIVLKNDSIVLFDEEYNRITNVRDLDNVYYGYFKTDNDAAIASELIYDWSGTYEIKNVNLAGFWMYVFEKSTFVKIDDEIERLEHFVNNLKATKVKIMSIINKETAK